MATLTGELISETYDALLKVSDNQTITGVKKRITDGFGNETPLLISSTDLEIDGNFILSDLANAASDTDKFLVLDGTTVKYRTGSQMRTDIGAGTVNSVGLTMPSAFSVANSPITDSGTLEVTAIGLASQYIRGNGTLADFPTSGGGGGSSVSYYLNGSVAQGTFVGNAYKEMNKTPILGAGTDFTINANGYIAQFITDAADPGALLIPAGNWDFETYFSASSGGGSPSFYIELYKYDGTAFTLIASNSAIPELISFGTSIQPYFSSIAVPETVLTVTDRLAIRVYVTHSGRTITLHTEDNHLSEIVTTFTTGLQSLNGLTKQAQYFAVGSTGTDFNISSSVDTHTFNIPSASATARGLITTGTQTIAGDKTFTSISANPTVIIKNTGIGRKFEVHNSGGSPVFYVDGLGATFITDNLSISSGTFNMGQTMLATGASYFQSSLKVTRFLSTQTYNIEFRTGALQTTATPNWYAGNFTGNNDFEITNYAAGANQTSLKINSTTNLVTLLAGISATTANFTGLLTGATATFTNSGSGIGVDVTNSGSGDGIKITHSLGRAFRIESSSTGYGILINNLTASTSIPFTIQKQGSTVITMSDTGAANFTGQLTLGSTITNGTYTYTLPSATGTLALTSALSSYLPLSGGTLTGALNGTSATFSQGISADVGSATSSIQVRNASTDAPFIGFFRGGTLRNTLQLLTDGSFKLTDASLVANAGLTMGALSGTSATFSGALDVTNTIRTDGASNSILLRNGYTAVIKNPNNNTRDLQIEGDGVTATFKGAGNVGIGTTSPTAKLQITSTSAGAATVGLFLNNNSATSSTETRIAFAANTNDDIASNRYSYISALNTSGSNGQALTFATNETGNSAVERMRITSGGDVIVKGSLANFTLGSSGAELFFGRNSANYITANGGGGAEIRIISNTNGVVLANGGTSWGSLSDENSKDIIEPIVNACDNLSQFRTIIGKYKTDDEDKRRLFLIAQDVEKVYPEAVFKIKNEEEEESLALNYQDLIPVLVKAIQELKAEIDLLKGEPIIPTDEN